MKIKDISNKYGLGKDQVSKITNGHFKSRTAL